jgi:uncharacterized protein (TIGR02466 family)
MNISVRDHLLPVFATPIGSFFVQDHATLNQALSATILEREAAAPGVTRSNAGGWHSEGNMVKWPLPEIEKLAGVVRQATLLIAAGVLQTKQIRAEMDMEAWANVSRRGNYNRMHNHPDWHYSAVYYVQTGQPDPQGDRQNGWIQFSDPRGVLAEGALPGTDVDTAVPIPPPSGGHFGFSFGLPPVAGGLLIFPSWLKHWVNPFEGEGERISIAFNLKLNGVTKVA